VTSIFDLFTPLELDEMLDSGYVRQREHPRLPLAILNYSERAAYDVVWNRVTRQCRGLIYRIDTGEVVARPFQKFFNYTEVEEPLDLDAHVVVTDKVDGSLGILYPAETNGRGRGFAIATRGSFESEQALHATGVWLDRYADDADQWVRPGLTYLFEIVYPQNRVVVDYGDRDDLVLLDVLETDTGASSSLNGQGWRGPRVDVLPQLTLREALEAEPRPGQEGLVVYFVDDGRRVKIKQDEYVALHRILTRTNARDVWEYAAVQACRELIADPKHWATYLGIDPARAAELLAVGDGWLDVAGIPDEFYAWIKATIDQAEARAGEAIMLGLQVAERAEHLESRQDRYDYVAAHAGPLVTPVMRLASGGDERALAELRLKAWRDATPEPTAPFVRTEDVA
jgi:RNA ligase